MAISVPGPHFGLQSCMLLVAVGRPIEATAASCMTPSYCPPRVKTLNIPGDLMVKFISSVEVDMLSSSPGADRIEGKLPMMRIPDN